MKTSRDTDCDCARGADSDGRGRCRRQGQRTSRATSAPAFDKLDTNRDGKISQAEASADTNIVFSSADANGDGYLDKIGVEESATRVRPARLRSRRPNPAAIRRCRSDQPQPSRRPIPKPRGNKQPLQSTRSARLPRVARIFAFASLVDLRP